MSFNTERLSHAYITDSTFANTLAMAVVCSAPDGKKPCMSCIHCDKAARNIHPDITVVKHIDNKHIISVDQIREVKKDVYLVPNDAEKKAYLIENADSMNINAQNALLQVLEEPPAHTVFILSTNNPAALLPTIYSRCVDLKAHSPEDTFEDSDGPNELDTIVGDFMEALTGNNVKLMECMFSIDKLDRHAFQIFLALTREKIIQTLKESSRTGNPDTSKALVQAEKVIIKAGEMMDLNVSPGHISGFICASVI